jgi:hypothetical protein
VSEDEILRLLQEMQARVDKVEQNLQDIGVQIKTTDISSLELQSNPIYDALLILSEPLAQIYAQVKIDIEKNDRVSWVGTAHGIREVLSGILHILAPDDAVTKEPGYKQQEGTSGPTQKQRAMYILKRRGAGSSNVDVVKEVEKIEDWIGNLIRATYNRASTAAHGFADKRETVRILRYFEAFAYDLLDLKHDN